MARAETSEVLIDIKCCTNTTGVESSFLDSIKSYG
jgi:hypothetical protein